MVVLDAPSRSRALPGYTKNARIFEGLTESGWRLVAKRSVIFDVAHRCGSFGVADVVLVAVAELAPIVPAPAAQAAPRKHGAAVLQARRQELHAAAQDHVAHRRRQVVCADRRLVTVTRLAVEGFAPAAQVA